MSAPAPVSAPPRKPRFGLSPRAWLLIAAAVAVGALLFLALWLDQRNDRDFYRAGEQPRGVSGQAFDPLPAPQTGEGNASGMPEPDMDAPRTADRIEPSSPPPIPPPPPIPVDPPPVQTAVELAPGSAPIALETPPPRYPVAALRRGETGEVLLRIEVDVQGLPASVEVIRSSGSRLLDRAAMDAVREWRFRPGQRDGQPVPGTVHVPITFDSR